jgi:hypothetical protein
MLFVTFNVFAVLLLDLQTSVRDCSQTSRLFEGEGGVSKSITDYSPIINWITEKNKAKL